MEAGDDVVVSLADMMLCASGTCFVWTEAGHRLTLYWCKRQTMNLPLLPQGSTRGIWAGCINYGSSLDGHTLGAVSVFCSRIGEWRRFKDEDYYVRCPGGRERDAGEDDSR